MHSNKIRKLSDQVENILLKQQSKINKLNHLEEEVKKIHNYMLRPENMNLNEETQSMNYFIRKGETGGLLTKALNSGENDGGVTITPSLNRKIIDIIAEKSVMRKIASVEKISTRSMDIIHEEGAFSSGWVAEGAERTDTDNAKLKKQSIFTHEIYAQPKATQNLIDDAEINIETWLVSKIADSFTRLENKAFLNGNGVNKPKGILQNEQIERIEAGNKVSAELLLKLINHLDEAYLNEAVFLMNRKTLSMIQSLRDENGRFIWNQSLSDPLAQTIFGIPVLTSPHIPDIGADGLAVALGNFKNGYKIVDRENMKLMRDPFTEKPYVKFYAVKRLGGDVVNPAAIKFAKFSA